MKLNTLFLGLTLALSATTASAFEYLFVVDSNYNRAPKLVGDQEANGSPYFIDFPNRAVGFEGYSETNFGGEKQLVDADNVHLTYSEQFKSYKIVNTTSTSIQDAQTLYLRVGGEACVDVSYRIPSLGVASTNIGQFCPESQDHSVLNLATLALPLTPTDTVEVLLRSINVDDKQLLGAFSFSAGENNSVKVSPNSIVRSDTIGTYYSEPNLVEIDY